MIASVQRSPLRIAALAATALVWGGAVPSAPPVAHAQAVTAIGTCKLPPKPRRIGANIIMMRSKAVELSSADCAAQGGDFQPPEVVVAAAPPRAAEETTTAAVAPTSFAQVPRAESAPAPKPATPAEKAPVTAPTVVAAKPAEPPAKKPKPVARVTVAAAPLPTQRPDLAALALAATEAAETIVAASADDGAAADEVAGLLGLEWAPDAVGELHALVVFSDDVAMRDVAPTDAGHPAEQLAGILSLKFGADTTLLRNPSRREILTELFHARQSLTADDNLFIFIDLETTFDAVHQTTYWLPSDATRADRSNWISEQSVADAVSAMLARSVLVVSTGPNWYDAEQMDVAAAASMDAAGYVQTAALATDSLQLRARLALTAGGAQSNDARDRRSFSKTLLASLRGASSLIDAGELMRMMQSAAAAPSAALPLMRQVGEAAAAAAAIGDAEATPLTGIASSDAAADTQPAARLVELSEAGHEDGAFVLTPVALTVSAIE